MRIPHHFFPFQVLRLYATLRVITDLVNMAHFAPLPFPPEMGRRVLIQITMERRTLPRESMGADNLQAEKKTRPYRLPRRRRKTLVGSLRG